MKINTRINVKKINMTIIKSVNPLVVLVALGTSRRYDIEEDYACMKQFRKMLHRRADLKFSESNREMYKKNYFEILDEYYYEDGEDLTLELYIHEIIPSCFDKKFQVVTNLRLITSIGIATHPDKIQEGDSVIEFSQYNVSNNGFALEDNDFKVHLL